MKCILCKNEFSEDSFYRDKSRPSGRKPRCKQCEKLYQDKELRKKYEKEYREANPDKRRAIMRSWYERNKDKYQSVQERYRQTERFRLLHLNHGAVRRARIRGAKNEPIDYGLIYSQSPFCFYCNKSLSINEVEFDHFHPIAKGGDHTPDNIRVSCVTCNRRKGAMTYQVV